MILLLSLELTDARLHCSPESQGSGRVCLMKQSLVQAILPCWCDSRWDASCYLETEHISIFSSPILLLNFKPDQPKGKKDAVCLRIVFFFFRVLFWNPAGKAWLRPSQPLSCKTFQTKTSGLGVFPRFPGFLQTAWALLPLPQLPYPCLLPMPAPTC